MPGVRFRLSDAVAIILAACALLGPVLPVMANDYNWKGPDNGSFNTKQNWQPSSTTPGISDGAIIPLPNSGTSTITISLTPTYGVGLISVSSGSGGAGVQLVPSRTGTLQLTAQSDNNTGVYLSNATTGNLAILGSSGGNTLTLALSNADTGANTPSFSLSNATGGILITAPMTGSGNLTITNTNTSATGVVSGGASFGTATGTYNGAVVLMGSGSHSGTTAVGNGTNRGYLNLGSGTALSGSTVTVSSGGQLQLGVDGGATYAFKSGTNLTLSGSGTNVSGSATGALVVGANVSSGTHIVSNNISLASTTVTVNATSGNTILLNGVVSGTPLTNGLTSAGAGTLILAGNNTYTGATTINAGTLQIGNAGTTGSVAGDITNNATLTFNRSNALTYSGAISGTGAVNQNGGGALTLSGANTYTGATKVNTGSMLVNGSLGNTPVTVASGGTLGGTGTITQSGANGVTVQSGGFITGGTGGTTKLSITPGSGKLNLAGGSTYQVKLFDTGNTDISLIAVTGNVSIDGTANTGSKLTLDLSALSAAQVSALSATVGQGNTRSYDIVTYTGTLTGSFSATNFSITLGNFAPGQWTLGQQTSGHIQLNYTPVPEPGMVLGIAAGALGLGGLVRRLRRVRESADSKVCSRL
jgi:autotransporter-associated beta strand protein